MKNILFSTTRQWNPGDEFILFGAINLLNMKLGEFNPIIFNRNPDIRSGFFVNKNPDKIRRRYLKWSSAKSFRGKIYIEKLMNIEQMDNSFKDRTSPEIIDLVVFAGSPEWYSKRMEPLFHLIKKYKIPTIFLAIGLGESIEISTIERKIGTILKDTKLLTTRDLRTEAFLKRYNAQYLPCTALLSAKKNHIVEKVTKIGLIYATSKATICNSINDDTYLFLRRFYKELNKTYQNFSIVCHYIDEIEEAKRDFPEANIVYSYDAKDYIEIYNKFDLVIGSRVHGIGISASLGIPGIMVAHDLRSNTVEGFCAQIINYNDKTLDECMEIVEDTCENIKELSMKLIAHKDDTIQKYGKLLDGIESNVWL